MRLLLTSSGLTNASIAKALEDLVGKPPKSTKVAFVPTASNIEAGNKDWLIDDLYRIKQQGYYIDIVDISALDPKQWQPRLEAADILFFGGGDSFYLMHWIKRSGLIEILPNLLESRVYVGLSAGSTVAGKNLRLSQTRWLYDDEGVNETMDQAGLGLVDFLVRSHLNSPYFPKVRAKQLREISAQHPEVIYALDDQSAIKVDEDTLEIVSEGEYMELNN